mmetsp:Transcript_38486/g.63797  ORF Transcript_38486/g.63797 Transcript_38486/m.63797 type:complete len:99 (+) Transcript_38486:635-931(+)
MVGSATMLGLANGIPTQNGCAEHALLVGSLLSPSGLHCVACSLSSELYGAAALCQSHVVSFALHVFSTEFAFGTRRLPLHNHLWTYVYHDSHNFHLVA